MPLRSDNLRILLTDAETRSGLGAVRSLGRAGHTVIAAYPEGRRRPPSLSSRYCGGELRYPDPQNHPAAFSEWLLDRVHREPVDVVLPISEAAVPCVASIREQFPTTVLPVVPGDRSLKYTLSKFYSTRLALELAIPCPRTIFLSSGREDRDWQRRLSDIRYPAVIKTDNHFTLEGAHRRGRRFLARGPDEVCTAMAALAGLDVRIIAQEFVPGSGLGAFLLRFGGKTHLTFAHRRLHEVPYTGGFSSFRESCHADDLVRISEALLDAIGYEGVAMVEFRRRATDGRPLFLEINGRLWGSLALALHCGVDFPAALIECYQYGAPRHTARGYRAKVKCRTTVPGDVNYLWSVLRAKPAEGDTPPPSRMGAVIEFIALSLDPRVRHDHLWWSDPLPAFHNVRHWLSGLASQRLRRVWQRAQRLRQRAILEGLRRKHRIRGRKTRYFEQPLRRILFLCHGNICRSAFAVACWNATASREPSRTLPEAVSSGLHPESDRRTPGWFTDMAAAYGVDLRDHRSRSISERDVNAADAIFVMDRSNYHALVARFPSAKRKAYFLGWFAEPSDIDEIADPYTRDQEFRRRCCEQIAKSIDGLRRRVVASVHIDAKQEWPAPTP